MKRNDVLERAFNRYCNLNIVKDRSAAFMIFAAGWYARKIADHNLSPSGCRIACAYMHLREPRDPQVRVNPAKLKRAKIFLERYLSNGPHPAMEVRVEAAELCIDSVTLQAAAFEIGTLFRKKHPRGETEWQLPPKTPKFEFAYMHLREQSDGAMMARLDGRNWFRDSQGKIWIDEMFYTENEMRKKIMDEIDSEFGLDAGIPNG